MHLFKMKNFLRQVRAMFGLMHLWSIDGCLEIIEYCLTKSRLFDYPSLSNSTVIPTATTTTTATTTLGLNTSTNISKQTLKKQISVISMNMSTESISSIDLKRLTTDYMEQMADIHRNLTVILTSKKAEFTAYKELTRCARLTLEKYYEHQQIQDAAGFYDKTEQQGFSSTNVIDKTFNQTSMNKMKKVCQKCLTWQFAKSQLESSTSTDDQETNELIMDLFLLNDQFISAKYLIRKLGLGAKLQFKLDMGHLKHRLLNLNVSSSIIVIDLDHILKECISFGKADADEAGQVNENEDDCRSKYVFDICFKLLNEFKDLNELNNQGKALPS